MDRDELLYLTDLLDASAGQVPTTRAAGVTVTEDALVVRLRDGGVSSVPLAWFLSVAGLLGLPD